MTGDERWAWCITAPALVVSVPLYLVFTVYYLAAREAFEVFLDYLEADDGAVTDDPVRDELVPGGPAAA